MKKLILTAMAVMVMATGAVAGEGESTTKPIIKFVCDEHSIFERPLWQRALTFGILSTDRYSGKHTYQTGGGLTGLRERYKTNPGEFRGLAEHVILPVVIEATAHCTDDNGAGIVAVYRRGENGRPATYEQWEVKP